MDCLNYIKHSQLRGGEGEATLQLCQFRDCSSDTVFNEVILFSFFGLYEKNTGVKLQIWEAHFEVRALPLVDTEHSHAIELRQLRQNA